jgi:hypothetical protein
VEGVARRVGGMLCFSASRCRGYLHAKSLGTGGEYLSYVWLLLWFMVLESVAERQAGSRGRISGSKAQEHLLHHRHAMELVAPSTTFKDQTFRRRMGRKQLLLHVLMEMTMSDKKCNSSLDWFVLSPCFDSNVVPSKALLVNDGFLVVLVHVVNLCLKGIVCDLQLSSRCGVASLCSAICFCLNSVYFFLGSQEGEIPYLIVLKA